MPSIPNIPADACALLVLSCDAYSDLWTPFFKLLDRWWPDCPFEVYLGAGELSCGRPGVTVLKSDGGRDWSRCLRDYLEQLTHPHVLIMLDDFFLRRRVATGTVMHCLEFARANGAIQLRLIPDPKPTDRLPGEALIGECGPGLPYRLCMQAAIWDRRALLSLLCPGESIWEFERRGNERALASPHGFYATWGKALPYDGLWARHVVEKGKWLPHEKWIFGRQNIGCDFTRRGTLPWSQTVVYHLAQWVHYALNVLPGRTKVRAIRTLRSLLYPLFRRSIDRLGQPPEASRAPTSKKDP